MNQIVNSDEKDIIDLTETTHELGDDVVQYIFIFILSHRNRLMLANLHLI